MVSRRGFHLQGAAEIRVLYIGLSFQPGRDILKLIKDAQQSGSIMKEIEGHAVPKADRLKSSWTQQAAFVFSLPLGDTDGEIMARRIIAYIADATSMYPGDLEAFPNMPYKNAHYYTRFIISKR
jgi:hypothetical protein